MKLETRQILLVGIIVGVGLAQLGCTDWSKRKKWPKQYKFKGQVVQFHERYLTGDHDRPDAHPGQKPAIRRTYYSYVKDGKEILHGKSTYWYDNDNQKDATTYIHGQRQNYTAWYPGGKVCERVEMTADGETRKFFGRRGKCIGIQYFDRKSKKLTCMLKGKKVPLNDFMFEINRIVYDIKRITP